MGLQEEITELEQRFAEAPDSRLFLPLADALRRAGELERAEKLCREGLERFPAFNSARILLGECLAEGGKLELAVRELEAAASLDSGNRRLKAELAEISEKMGDSGKAAGSPSQSGVELPEVAVPPEETGKAVGTAADSDESDSVAEAREAESAEHSSGSDSAGESEMFITRTLGDIYRMQGHDRKALEIYNKLVEEGQRNPELKTKIDEIAARLGKEPPQIIEPPVEALAPDAAVGAETDPVPAARDEGRYEERIDTIFHFLLGDSPEHGEGPGGISVPTGVESAGAGSGDFVDLIEDWLDGLKQE
ncbi:MAG: tetratricopeptide repeat protein [Candidatus Glassbacteria bacterium]|nr:tetratricopeptide repeat protein [Candidatus Glassbacteria bacterium]